MTAETRAAQDIEVLEALSRNDTYKRRIHEREVLQENEMWVLSWTGRSEMLINGAWETTEEYERFSSRRDAVEWMAQGFPTLH